MSRIVAATALTLLSIAFVDAAVWNITVGINNTLAFSPSNLTIAVNDTVVYNGTKIDTTIDTSLPVSMVVRGLVATIELTPANAASVSSAGSTSPSTSPLEMRPANEMCLRMLETDELVTDESLRRRIKDQDHLKLCPHPTIEASDLADRLRALTTTPQGAAGADAKRVLFVLQRYLKEPDFSASFVLRGGAQALQRCVSAADGNTLAYALQAMHYLVEQKGWEGLDVDVVGGVSALVLGTQPPLPHSLIEPSVAPAPDMTTIPLVDSRASSLQLVTILVREELTNICRPATAILAKLVSSPPTAPAQTPSEPSPTPQPQNSTDLTGFDSVSSAMSTQSAFLPTLVRRLSAPDPTMQLASLHLLNVLIRHASHSARDDFTRQLEALHCSSHVARMALVGGSEEAKTHLAEYQTLAVRELHRKKRRAIVLDGKASAHGKFMQEVWSAAVDVVGGQAEGRKWRKVGFSSENPRRELARVGELGLENLHNFVRTCGSLPYVGPPGVVAPTYLQGPSGPAAFARLLAEQQQKPVERRCPVAKGSMEVTEMLSDYWEIGTGYSTSTTLQPLLLAFDQAHAATLELWIRTWRDLDAVHTSEDVQKVSAMVRSQFKYSVAGVANAGVPLQHQGQSNQLQQQPISSSGGSGSGPGAAAAAQQAAATAVTAMVERFRKDMLEVPFVVIRQRMQKEIEMEDDLMSKAAIKNLRDALFKESYQFVKQQRLSCLQAGAWFPVVTTKGRVKNTHRFYRLTSNRKTLHWAEFQGDGVTARKPDMTELGEKIDLTNTIDILTGAAVPLLSSKKINENPALCFSLSSSSGGDTGNADISTLADFFCESPTQLAEWVDGFGMLFERNMSSKETSSFVQQLADTGVKLALLDLTGDKVDIPSTEPDVPELPVDVDFYYQSATQQRAVTDVKDQVMKEVLRAGIGAALLGGGKPKLRPVSVPGEKKEELQDGDSKQTSKNSGHSFMDLGNEAGFKDDKVLETVGAPNSKPKSMRPLSLITEKPVPANIRKLGSDSVLVKSTGGLSPTSSPKHSRPEVGKTISSSSSLRSNTVQTHESDGFHGKDSQQKNSTIANDDCVGPIDEVLIQDHNVKSPPVQPDAVGSVEKSAGDISLPSSTVIQKSKNNESSRTSSNQRLEKNSGGIDITLKVKLENETDEASPQLDEPPYAVTDTADASPSIIGAPLYARNSESSDSRAQANEFIPRGPSPEQRDPTRTAPSVDSSTAKQPQESLLSGRREGEDDVERRDIPEQQLQ
ncbi:hypothetical protein HDU93_006511 [Gonapodya sp. JEL0774]|nr:hypothetical protein HDU93_006511 [Gonapodya sp. JEL0774]